MNTEAKFIIPKNANDGYMRTQEDISDYIKGLCLLSTSVYEENLWGDADTWLKNDTWVWEEIEHPIEIIEEFS